jgi:hypothetical protein
MISLKRVASLASPLVVAAIAIALRKLLMIKEELTGNVGSYMFLTIAVSLVCMVKPLSAVCRGLIEASIASLQPHI